MKKTQINYTADLKNITLKTNDIYEKRKIDKTDFKADLHREKHQIMQDFEELVEMLKFQVADCKK